MDGFLAGLQFWHWLILAAVLAAIEPCLGPGPIAHERRGIV